MTIHIKRIYEEPAPTDGRRILIDRLWARGMSKARAQVDAWMKELAPSNELRQWYQHDPEKWQAFQVRYFKELDAQPEAVAALLAEASAGPITLLFSSRETQRNNANALKAYLENHATPSS